MTSMWTAAACRRRRGVALISVMAILAMLGVVAFAFLMAARLELAMSKSFQQFMRVEDVTEAALKKTNTALANLQNGPDNIPYSGDEPRPYDSHLDSWYEGFFGALDRDSIYSSRGHIPGRLLPAAGFTEGLTDPEYYLPTSLDEDPPGDLSVQMGFDSQTAPGLSGIDDDGDGLTDEDNLGVSQGQAGYNSFFNYDDDEDGQVDEDPGYLPPDSTFVTGGGALIDDPRTNPYLKEHTYVDDDGDLAGVVDHSGLLNLNWVGNKSLRYDDGINSFEIDLPSFFFNLGWSAGQAETMARAIIDYRLGTDGVPGAPGDDNGNNASDVGFNGRDDDGDGETDEFDEIYLGSPQAGMFNTFSTIILGDGLDNDGDGVTDEDGEGIDEPSEFNRVFDNNFGSIDELALVPGFARSDFTFGATSNFDKVRNLVTIYSCSPQISSGCGEVVNDPVKGPYSPGLINPSLLLTFQARSNSLGGINYLSPIQIDNDGDWNPDRDDHNKNGRPDGDWDSGPEKDTRDARFSSDGLDNDHDGTVDEPGEGNGLDDDRDALIDDDGDINGDGNTGYDPEWHVNEDPWGDANGDGYPGVQGVDDDGDGGDDYNDPEVSKALAAINLVGYAQDGIDNDLDGETDELGEPYVAAWDDDEDGRFDEDPPEFPWLLNIIDSIDQPIAGFDSPTVAQLYAYTGRQVSDPFLRFAAYLGTTLDQMPVPLTSQPDGGLAPVAPGDKSAPYQDLNCVGVYKGLESVRLNEVMACPVIHLEAENADSFQNAKDFGGDTDDTPVGGGGWIDTSWSDSTTTQPFGATLRITPYTRELYDTGAVHVNRAYYTVVNDPYHNSTPPLPIREDTQDEEAAWTWNNVPAGVYDVVFTLGPALTDPFDAKVATLLQDNIEINGQPLTGLGGWNRTSLSGDFRTFTVDDVTVDGGQLQIKIKIPAGLGSQGEHPASINWTQHDILQFSFDSVDLYAKDMQYLELVNLSRLPVDVSGWQIWVTGQSTNKYIISQGAVIPAYDPLTPTDYKNYLLVMGTKTSQSRLEAFYNTTITVPVQEAVAADGKRLAFSELFLTNPVLQAGGKFSGARLDISPREGTIQLVGPVAGSGINLVVLDEMKYFTYRLNPLKPTARMGFLAQERRDPAELRFTTATDVVGNNRVASVTQETPTMRFYAREAERPAGGSLNRMRMLGGRTTDAQDDVLSRYLGLYFAETQVTDTAVISFRWPHSQQLAMAQLEGAVYEVRVFGLLNHPVGQVVIPEPPASSDLNLNLLAPLQDGTNKDLYVNPTTRLTRAQMHHGNLVFYWYPREQGDLQLDLVCDGEARDLIGRVIPSDQNPGFYFEYVEVTRVGEYNPGDRLFYYRAGTPGAPNPFYLPDVNPQTGAFWTDPTQPYDPRITRDFGLDRDGKTQRFVAVKDGAMASPGYLVTVPNGQPFGRYGVSDVSPSFAFLTGWRNQGAMLPGQININTAPLPVLAALPWAPPSLSTTDRGEWNGMVARHVILGRRLVGHDGVFGAVDQDGDGVFDPQPQTAYRQRGSDDGPYQTVADLIPVLFSRELYNDLNTRFPGQVDKGDLTMAFARVYNLATTRSLVFSVFSRGQVLDLSPDRDELVVSQKVLEAIFLRFAQ